MIQSFGSDETEKLFLTGKSRVFSSISTVAQRKLRVLDSTRRLDDLRQPYGNHLEAMAGDRKGQHSIRINDQYRICFVWIVDEPHDVEIVDYHRGR